MPGTLATDLRAAIIIEVADPAQRDQWPLGDWSLPKRARSKLRDIYPKSQLSIAPRIRFFTERATVSGMPE